MRPVNREKIQKKMDLWGSGLPRSGPFQGQAGTSPQIIKDRECERWNRKAPKAIRRIHILWPYGDLSISVLRLAPCHSPTSMNRKGGEGQRRFAFPFHSYVGGQELARSAYKDRIQATQIIKEKKEWPGFWCLCISVPVQRDAYISVYWAWL